MSIILPVRKITIEEKNIAEAFQEMLRLVMSSFDSKGKLKSLQDFKHLKRNAKRFANYPFAQDFFNFIKYWDNEFKKYFQNKRQGNRPSTLAELKYISNQVEKDLMAGIVNIELVKKLEQLNNQLTAKTDNIDTKRIKNPFYIENPLIFQTTNFIRQFEVSDQQQIIEKDLNKFKYTYLDIPDSKKDDFQYLVYWIDELKSSNEDVQLSASKYNKFTYFKYDNIKEFHQLTKDVKEYLSSNNKKLLSTIIQNINSIPELKKAHDSLKTEKLLFRGLGFEKEMNKKEILDTERTNRYVATSESKYVAENFSFNRGHLESIRRSEYGVILTYQATPESIILDTNIFGGIFYESEIVIDVTKAKLVDYEESYKDFEIN